MHPLVQTITSLQRRLVWRRRAVAAYWMAATVLAAALVLGTIDYLVQYADPGLRIMATMALLLAATWAVYRWWYVPARQALVPLAVARQVEAHFPQLRDSLASAVEFLQQSEDDRTAGSAQLRRLVVTEAQTAVEELPLDKVIDRRPLRRAAAWLCIVAAVVAVCVALDARAVGTAALRLAAPLGHTEWPRQHRLVFRDVPTRLAAGQTFEVELVDTAGPLPDDVRIHYRDAASGGTQSSSEPMTPAGDVMVARRENVRNSFAFRADGGDDRNMRWHWVEVVEPPRLDALEIVTHPPHYTGLPAAPAERHLDVLAGTSIEIHGMASEPLGAARILLDGGEAIVADVGPGKSGPHGGSFHIPPGKWVATKSGPYSLELADAEGLAGVVGQWNLRVEPDSPPSISWQRPTSDLYVTASAVVPVEFVVNDNLAIHRVDLVYKRSDGSESDRSSQPTALRIELYKGREQPAGQSMNAAQQRGETRIVEHGWDLAPLRLPVGARLTVEAEATDYRPGTGRTASPRRVTVITADELEGRLADRQAQIVRQLERALAAQQTTREDVRRVEIQQRDAGVLTRGDRHTLETAELNQRRVARMLVDPAEGIPALVDSLLAEIEMNRLPGSELPLAMERLTAELDRLSSEPLSVADRELTAARKTLESVAPNASQTQSDSNVSVAQPQADQFSGSLATTGAAEDDVIATLERLVAELSGSSDYRRLAQQVAELRQAQMAHEKTARGEIGVETLPLEPSELSRAQRATLNKAAAGQSAIASRFEKIQRTMDRLAQELANEESDDAGKLAEAADRARRLAIGTDMQQTARDLAENRVGQALARETQLADKLQQLLDVLRDQSGRQPDQLAAKLREAEQRLAALRQQLAALRAQIAQAEAQSNVDPKQLQQLGKQQQSLQRDINQLAQQLDRLQADDAGKSTRSAADRLDKRPPNDNQQAAQPQRASPTSAVQKAEQDLKEAARQLAERRQQAEDDLALEFVRRFQAELADMVRRQQRVVNETVALDAKRRPDAALTGQSADAVAALAGEERQLGELAREHSELLAGLGAVRISLEDAERQLAAAARRLDEHDTGAVAQQAERHALARLEAMLQAFAQTSREAAPQNQPPNPGAPAGQPPPRRPTFELLEVKMLRMLQVDLHERTREFEQRLAGVTAPPNGRQWADLAREARDLRAEQGRLAELVQQMLTRDNEEGRE